MTKTQVLNAIEKSSASGMVRVRLERTVTDEQGIARIESGFIGTTCGRSLGFVTRKRFACEFLGYVHALGWVEQCSWVGAGVTFCDVVPA